MDLLVRCGVDDWRQGRSGGRHPYRAIAVFGLYIAAAFFYPVASALCPTAFRL